MASSIRCFFVVTLAVLSQFFLTPTLASIKNEFIDANCQRAKNKPFCIQTLTTYPSTASANGMLPLAEAVLGLAIPHAEKTADFAAETARKDAKLKTQFSECNDAYVSIVASLKSAKLGLTESADTANYDVMLCSDEITRVKGLVEKNTDMASKKLMEMTFQMEKLLDLSAAATDAVDDDNENVQRRA